MEPSSRCLFESVDGLFEKAHMIWVLRIYETRRLSHIYCLMKVSMKESILNIKLSEGPFLRDGNRENRSDGSGFDYRTERFLIVNPGLLPETLGDESRFVASDGSIFVSF